MAEEKDDETPTDIGRHLCLPPSYKEFKHTLKHHKEELSLVQLDSHVRLRKSFRDQESEKEKVKPDVGHPFIHMVKEKQVLYDVLFVPRLVGVVQRLSRDATEESRNASNPLSNFEKSRFDSSSSGVIICLYVDDMLIFGTDQLQVDENKSLLSSKFTMKDMVLSHQILKFAIWFWRPWNGKVQKKAEKTWKLDKVNSESFSRPRSFKLGAAKRANSRMFMLFTDFASIMKILAPRSRQRPSTEDSKTC
ncbi:hypothetical protein OSB04_027848 [Centaurea solstitialis]|uniref:Reverse transcriptase Ty1/copia-type domain-containing protein n=1 Tax=Centaurea solstitialis TaxID=347529 RepID=A0AA38VX38_9ASTR|nr:hypothetical protein OSB04_027848 [Centaurea solstitialis]